MPTLLTTFYRVNANSKKNKRNSVFFLWRSLSNLLYNGVISVTIYFSNIVITYYTT